jgi:hypothetical protein
VRERLKTERDAKAEAAKVASEAFFAASPLPEIGQAIWRGLWVRIPTMPSRHTDLKVTAQPPLRTEAPPRIALIA